MNKIELKLLIVYYSKSGNIEKLANNISRGINSVDGVTSILRTVPKVSFENEKVINDIPNDGPPYVTNDDILECSGIGFGSPTRFGNMSAPIKYFIDGLVTHWHSGFLVDKPAIVFTSANSLHGGHESTLLSMMNPIFHLGMIPIGVPYTGSLLDETKSGGTPYGPSFLGNKEGRHQEDEKSIAFLSGKRFAKIALLLAHKKNEQN